MAFSERFGELLGEGIVSVAKKQRKNIRAVEQEIAETLHYKRSTVERWRRGYVPQEPDQVAYLARYCVAHGRVDRDWVRSLLIQTDYPGRRALLQELFPKQSQRTEAPRIYQNLPPRYGEFLGREADMARVLDGLKSRWPLISIEGLGGVGKTTLAIEAARCCLPGPNVALASPFDAVVWVSAKDRPEQRRWLNDVLDAIAWVLNYPYISQLAPKQKPLEVDKLLRAYRTLVIVDNFETIEDPDLVAWMQRVPEPSKIIFTSRHAQMRQVWPIHLRGLEEPEAIELLRRHARRLELHTLKVADEDVLLPLVRVTEGNPKAIEMALGYVKYSAPNLNEVVDHLYAASKTVSGLFEGLFARTWAVLSEDARQALMVVPFFVSTAGKEALGAAAGLAGYRLDVAVEQLVEMSLLDKSEEVEAYPCYDAHPLTRAFASVKSHELPEWEREARERWFGYFLEFARRYTGRDWDDWGKYKVARPELPNLLAVCQWGLDNRCDELSLELFDEVGHLLFVQCMWEEDIQISQDAVLVARQIGDANLLSVWLRKRAWTLIWKGEFAEARTLLSEAKELAEKTGYIKVLREATHDMGVLYYREENYQEAVSELQRSLAFAYQLEYDREIIGDQYYLGCIAFVQGDFDQARERFELVKELGHKIGWARAYAYARNWLADIERMQGNYTQARQLLEEGLPVAQNFKDRRRIAFFKLSFALLEEAESNIEVALAHAHEACDLFHRLGMEREEARTSELIERLEGGLTGERVQQ